MEGDTEEGLMGMKENAGEGELDMEEKAMITGKKTI